MASNETDLINTLFPWILGAISVIGSIWAGFKILICKGKNAANEENRIKFIEDRVSDMIDRFETFKKWADSEHKEMNESVERKFSELQQDIVEIKQAQAETNGYLKRLAEEKTS